MTISLIHSSMALQPFVGSWLLLQLCNLFYTHGMTSWTSNQPVARPLPTHRTLIINTHTDIHALSWIRNSDPSFRASEDSSCLRPRGHRDRQLRQFTSIFTNHNTVPLKEAHTQYTAPMVVLTHYNKVVFV
jgi:hypothetical protein